MRRTRLRSIGLLGPIFLALTTANADPVKPVIVPECRVFVTKAGTEVCGYDRIEDVRALYSADAELVAAREKIVNLEAARAELDTQVAALMGALDAMKGSNSALSLRNRELTESLLAENKKLEEERVKPRWGSPVAWTTAAILGSLLVGFVGADLID